MTDQEKLIALLNDLKREYEKVIGWSDLSEKYFKEIIFRVKKNDV